MPKLYVSDLDGTLLRSDATLSDFSRQTLARLLDGGLAFTVASARSVVAMQTLLAGLGIRLPVIELNGAMLSDLATARHQVVHAIEPALLADLYAFLRKRAHSAFLSCVDGHRDHLYYAETTNEGMAWYVKDRIAARDTRLRRVDALTACFGEAVVAVTLVERRETLEETRRAIAERFPGAVATNFFENGYSPGWFWLTLHDRRATKDQAVRELLELTGVAPSDLVVFGDHWNDITMFQIAIAVANAADELKAHATELIGTNDDDAVAKYIATDWPA